MNHLKEPSSIYAWNNSWSDCTYFMVELRITLNL